MVWERSCTLIGLVVELYEIAVTRWLVNVV
jgi:hypothetical protein